MMLQTVSTSEVCRDQVGQDGDKSTNDIKATSPLSIALKMLPRTLRTAVLVEWLVLLADCGFDDRHNDMRLLEVTMRRRRSKDGTDQLETGR